MKKNSNSIKKWDTDRILRMIEGGYRKEGLVDYWNKECFSISKIVVKLGKRLEDEYEVRKCIAVAGSRIVLQIREKNSNLDFALKICRPFEDAVSLVVAEFKNVGDLYHPNLIRIIWQQSILIKQINGKKRSKGKDFPVPVTMEEFVPDGRNLHKWLDEQLNTIKSEKDILMCLKKFHNFSTQIIKGIHYLHKNDRFHCDIKPDNILLSGDTIKIVDFGYSKRIYPGLHYFDEKSISMLGFTWKYAHPSLRKNIRKIKSLDAVYTEDKKKLSLLKIDKYALGRTIEECIRKITFKRNQFEQQIQESDSTRLVYSRESKYWEKYIRLVADRLKGGDAFEDLENQDEISRYPLEVVKSIEYLDDVCAFEEAIEDLNRINDDDLGAIAPEWNRSLIDRIQVGQTQVAFTPRIRRLFNHPALARLSRVSQLGLVGLVYPAARHSRLEHSMGVYSYTCRYIESLWSQKDNPFFRCITSAEEVIAASLAALFHDLGQYPHCHDIEDAMPSLKGHEKYSRDIYLLKWKMDEDYESLYRIIEIEWGYKVADRVKRYLNPFTDSGILDPRAGILRGIISGPIDADKLDYVQRDSINLGTGYGMHVEQDRLIQNLRPVMRCSGKKKLPVVTLGITYKGLLPAHSLIVAREQLSERVYWHKTIRSFKAMLATALRRGISESGKTGCFQMKDFSDLIWDEIRLPTQCRNSTVKIKYPEAFHLVESDYSLLSRIESSLIDRSSKYLINQIIHRRPYHSLIDLGTADWMNPSDRNKMENAIAPLRHLLITTPNRFDLLEVARLTFQNLLLDGQFIKPKNNNVLKDKNFDAAKKVAVILDVPRERSVQSMILVAGKDGEEDIEVDLGIFHGGVQQGWIKSIVPRIYLNPLFTATEFYPHEIVPLIQKASVTIIESSLS